MYVKTKLVAYSENVLWAKSGKSSVNPNSL